MEKQTEKLFELEQQIMSTWAIVDYLDLLCENVCEETLSTDELANGIIGIKTMLELQLKKLNSTFENALQMHYQSKKEELL